MDELKKCPFCGGKAAVVVNRGVKVICLTCGVQTTPCFDFDIQIDHDRPNAVQRVVSTWNRRVRDDE